MLKHKTVKASIYSFIHSAKRYSRTCSVARLVQVLEIEKKAHPALLGIPVALLAGVAIIVTKWACHAIWAVHLFSLVPTNRDIMMNQTERRLGRMGLCDVPKCPLLTFERRPIHKCLVVTVSICHQFYQQCLQGWRTPGLLAHSPLLKAHGTPWPNACLAA